MPTARQEKLSGKFWYDLFRDFNIAEETAANLLDEPESDEGPTGELLECLSELHNNNQISSTVAPLQNFLAHCDTLSDVDMFGLMHAIVPSEDLTFANAVKGQVAVLESFARIAGENAQGKNIQTDIID